MGEIIMGLHLKLKVRNVGGSQGVVLPKEALALLNVQNGDELFLVSDSQGARLTPYDPELQQQLEAVDHVSRKYRDVFKALAQ
jgi:putative addiction module antidote